MAYLFAGGISYQLITKEFWDAPDSLLSSYLRTPGNAELWNVAMIWQIPAQLIRGLLIGLVLLPLYGPLKEWSASKKILFFSSMFFVLTHMASSAPSPANIEGLVYMKPEFIKLGFVKMQVEMILHAILVGIIFARYGYKKATPEIVRWPNVRI